MIAIGAPTGTSAPSGSRISTSVPDTNASISIVALSVKISAIVSPRCTGSPGVFSQRSTVPISIVALNTGMLTGTLTSHGLGEKTVVLLAFERGFDQLER